MGVFDIAFLSSGRDSLLGHDPFFLCEAEFGSGSASFGPVPAGCWRNGQVRGSFCFKAREPSRSEDYSAIDAQTISLSR